MVEFTVTLMFLRKSYFRVHLIRGRVPWIEVNWGCVNMDGTWYFWRKTKWCRRTMGLRLKGAVRTWCARWSWAFFFGKMGVWERFCFQAILDENYAPSPYQCCYCQLKRMEKPPHGSQGKCAPKSCKECTPHTLGTLRKVLEWPHEEFILVSTDGF